MYTLGEGAEIRKDRSSTVTVQWSPLGRLPDTGRILLLFISLLEYIECRCLKKCIHQQQLMIIGTETEADKQDSDTDVLAGFISVSYYSLPPASFSAGVIMIMEQRQLGL